MLQGAQIPTERKATVQIFCRDCGSGTEGGWEADTFDTINGAGCPACASLEAVQRSISRSHLSHCEVKLVADPYGAPNVRSLGYHVRSPTDGVRYDVSRWRIKSWIRKKSDPFTWLNRLILDIDRTEAAFKQAFPAGSLLSEDNLGVREGRTIDGVRFDLETGARVLRAPVSREAATYRVVWKLISQERADRLIAGTHQQVAESSTPAP